MPLCDWENLPTVVLYEIYQNLTISDRLKASIVCKKWRETFFYYPSWRSLRLSTTAVSQEKNSFFISKTSYFSKELAITYVADHYQELTDLIKGLSDSNLISDIYLVGSRIPQLPSFESQFNEVVYPFLEKCNRITRLYISHWVDPNRMLQLLSKHRKSLIAVGLGNCSPEAQNASDVISKLISVFEKCSNLEKLSLDSRWFSVDFLSWLTNTTSLPKLKNLSLHLDGASEVGNQFDNKAWMQFDSCRPLCDIHVNYENITEPTSGNILCLARNITRLRMFYCSEKFRNACIDSLMNDRAFHHTVKSIWSISHSHMESAIPSIDHLFVVCVWRYRNLAELVLSGTKFEEYDLEGMSRLRSSLRIRIAADDIVISENNCSRRLTNAELKKLDADSNNFLPIPGLNNPIEFGTPLIEKRSIGRKKPWSTMKLAGFNDPSIPSADREALAFEKAVRIDMT